MFVDNDVPDPLKQIQKIKGGTPPFGSWCEGASIGWTEAARRGKTGDLSELWDRPGGGDVGKTRVECTANYSFKQIVFMSIRVFREKLQLLIEK